MEMIETKNEKKEMKEKWTEFQGSVRYNHVDQHMHLGSPEVERGRGRESIWRNKGWKIPKFPERHEPKHPGSLMNPSKMNPCKMTSGRPTPATPTKAHYNQNLKENLESSKRDVNYYIQRIVNKIISRFCRKFGGWRE